MKRNVLTMAIATICLATMLTACSLDNEVEKPFTVCPVYETRLLARGISAQETETDTVNANVVFTEDDIEWFDVNTRELKFKKTKEELDKLLKPYDAIEFQLSGAGNINLFKVSNYVNLFMSQIFDDLVLCYGKADDPIELNGSYYLYDCYPPQFINTEIVQANREKRAQEWDYFLGYLEYKGKLRK